MLGTLRRETQLVPREIPDSIRARPSDPSTTAVPPLDPKTDLPIATPGKVAKEDPFKEDPFRMPGAAVKGQREENYPIGKVNNPGTAEHISSRTIHVLGYDPRAYYIAHAIAGCQYLDQVKLLMHRTDVVKAWHTEGQKLVLFQERNRITHKRAGCEWVGRGNFFQPSQNHIDLLLITLPAASTCAALSNIKHRIDASTTICLVQDGLGVVEHLNQALFTDPMTRPSFLLGNFSASVGYSSTLMFSAVLKSPGKLYLTCVENRMGSQPWVMYHPPIEQRPRPRGFLRTLATVPGLHAGGYSLEDFLIKKLPSMIFNCIAEPLSIILDRPYNQVLGNKEAIGIADQLLEEIIEVVRNMPELSDAAKADHISLYKLKAYMKKRLRSKGSSQSQTLSRVRAGRMVDIDFLNGYFVNRGRELGIPCPRNEIVIRMVKARLSLRRDELKRMVQFDTDIESIF